jgi:hypothetical protein
VLLGVALLLSALFGCAHAQPAAPVRCEARPASALELEIYVAGIKTMVDDSRDLTVDSMEVLTRRRLKAMFVPPTTVDAPFDALRKLFDDGDSPVCVEALAARLGMRPVEVIDYKNAVGVSRVVVSSDWAYFQAAFLTPGTFVIYGLLLDHTHGLWRLHSRYMILISSLPDFARSQRLGSFLPARRELHPVLLHGPTHGSLQIITTADVDTVAGRRRGAS